jgi:hypothetical protein
MQVSTARATRDAPFAKRRSVFPSPSPRQASAPRDLSHLREIALLAPLMRSDTAV